MWFDHIINRFHVNCYSDKSSITVNKNTNYGSIDFVLFKITSKFFFCCYYYAYFRDDNLTHNTII